MAFGIKVCFVVFLLVALQEGESLKCYQCSSALNGDCDNPLNVAKVKIQTCSSPHNSCLLLNVTDSGVTEVRRECAEDNYCDKNPRNRRQVTSYSRSCSTCSWGLCNSSPNLTPSLGVGVGIGLIIFKYYL